MDATTVICTREEAQYKNNTKGHHFERSYCPNDAILKGDYLDLATCWGLLAVCWAGLSQRVLLMNLITKGAPNELHNQGCS